MVVVISQRPGFLLACAEALRDMKKRQNPIASRTRVLFMIPPD
jgi:hypothetical protein